MPTFPTLGPLSIEIDVVVGQIRFAADQRADTVIDVRPLNLSEPADVRAADQTRVAMVGDHLVITGPRRKNLGLFTKVGEIDVTIALPVGSDVQAKLSVGDLRGHGRLGVCRLKTSAGSILLDHAAAADLRSDYGSVAVETVDGDAHLHAGSGSIIVGDVVGAGVVKNSNGRTTIGSIGGDLRAKAANGDIVVAAAGAGVTAQTACGDIRIGRVDHGSIVVETAIGELELGLPHGTAAMLDAHTGYGKVRTELADSDGPGATERTVNIRARNGCGDIRIHRSVTA